MSGAFSVGKKSMPCHVEYFPCDNGGFNSESFPDCF